MSRPKGWSEEDVKDLQRGLNNFAKNSKLRLAPVMVDGEMGKATRARIRTIKYFLGYRGAINAAANEDFRQRLYHPNDPKYSTRARVALGKKRRAQHRARKVVTNVAATVAPGVGRFDGRPVAKWMIPYLQWARQHGWRGTLNSGWRDPNYSRSLCIRMCGRASCPGRCAGLSSNHVGSARPRGAVDVSDYVRFGQLMRQCPYSPRIFNALGARDPVHFSASGN